MVDSMQIDPRTAADSFDGQCQLCSIAQTATTNGSTKDAVEVEHVEQSAGDQVNEVDAALVTEVETEAAPATEEAAAALAKEADQMDKMPTVDGFCNNCFGKAHHQAVCPSPNIKRSPATHITVLAAFLDNMKVRNDSRAAPAGRAAQGGRRDHAPPPLAAHRRRPPRSPARGRPS